MTNKQEPYWARYVKSWRKPKSLNEERHTDVKPLQHCADCSRTCDYYDHPGLCPYYNMQ
jgi:hypothetical protein